MSEDNKTPRISLREIAEDFGELSEKFHTGEGLPPRPFWLEVDGSAFRVTEENRRSLALGMLMYLDVRSYWDAKK